MSDTKQVRAAVRLLESQGWKVTHGSRHLRATSPDGKVKVTIPGSTSDHRAWQNWRSQVRRMGVVFGK